MSDLPNCPTCNSEYAYEDGNMYVCPECAHEWVKDQAAAGDGNEHVIKDANGNKLPKRSFVMLGGSNLAREPLKHLVFVLGEEPCENQQTLLGNPRRDFARGGRFAFCYKSRPIDHR